MHGGGLRNLREITMERKELLNLLATFFLAEFSLDAEGVGEYLQALGYDPDEVHSEVVELAKETA